MLRIPRILTLTPLGRPHVRSVVASGRAGGLGILDLSEFGERRDRETDRALIARTSEALRGRPFGLRVPDWETRVAALDLPPDNLRLILVPLAASETLRQVVEWAGRRGRFVLAEVGDESGAESAASAGADGLLIVGEEAGGYVGRSSSLVLLQAVLSREIRGLPVWVRGGVGLQNAAGWIAAGAAGVALDGAL
ncbi:MAG: hypothetical protein AB7I30_20040, partial [Isosphaeraceae bacterium]